MAASANEIKSIVAPANGTVAIEQAKDVQNLLPHLESLERIIKLPVVGAAWDKSQDVYQNVKGMLSSWVYGILPGSACSYTFLEIWFCVTVMQTQRLPVAVKCGRLLNFPLQFYYNNFFFNNSNLIYMYVYVHNKYIELPVTFTFWLHHICAANFSQFLTYIW